ncbi:MAG: hypothetical protein JOZ53_05220, partial [Planctomycetaceae bacterium]|nr:hypothetical protein [Planctomycetaceae bacterium]
MDRTPSAGRATPPRTAATPRSWAPVPEPRPPAPRPPTAAPSTPPHPVRPGPGGDHAPPDGEGHPRRPPWAVPPHLPRDGGQGPQEAQGARPGPSGPAADHHDRPGRRPTARRGAGAPSGGSRPPAHPPEAEQAEDADAQEHQARRRGNGG